MVITEGTVDPEKCNKYKRVQKKERSYSLTTENSVRKKKINQQKRSFVSKEQLLLSCEAKLCRALAKETSRPPILQLLQHKKNKWLCVAQ